MQNYKEELGYKKLNEVIKQKFGYDFNEYAKLSFKRRVNRILDLKKLFDVDILAAQIENNRFLKDDFLSEITVNVTELFRDPHFWNSMKSVLSELIKAKGKIKIWHHGCSSGEEVFSMLILLKELNILSEIEIVASDIDSNILLKAKAGKISLRNMDKNIENYTMYNPNGDFKRYFLFDKEYAYFDKELLSKVSFKQYNLIKDNFSMDCDVILCRNVMIYFNQQLQDSVLDLFYNNLRDNGYIALGIIESISRASYSDKFLPINNTDKIYKKV